MDRHETRHGRKTAWAAIVIALSLVVAACSGDGSSTGEGPGGDEGSPTRGGTVTVGLDQESVCYVPSLCSVSYAGSAVFRAAFDYLVYGTNESPGYELGLAESIEPNDDFTVWTATLRDGVLFSDGSALTATEVKTLFDTYIRAETSTLRGQVAAIDSVDAPDARTVVFNLSSPQAPFPALLTNIPIFKPTAGLTQTSIAVGPGPFMITDWTPNEEVRLERNPHYWRKADDGTQLPYLDELVFEPIPSADTRLRALETGDIQVALLFDPISANAASDLDGIGTTRIDADAGDGLFFNCASPPTDDVRVRQALAYATDRDELVAAVGGGEPMTQHFAESSRFYSEDAAEAMPHNDPDRASELIDDYVNDPDRSDGESPGSPLSIEISYVSTRADQQSIVQVAQQQWSDVGVDVTLVPKEDTTLISDASSGNFMVNYFSWATRPNAYNLLVRSYGNPADTPTNFTHFESQDLQDLATAMSTARSEDEIVQEADDASMVIAEQVPLIFVLQSGPTWAQVSDAVAELTPKYTDQQLDWQLLSTR